MLQVQLLDESMGPLALLYNQIIKFVERDLKKLAESAEVICVKSGSRKPRVLSLPSAPNTKEQGPRKGFDIMTNVVWVEIGQAIMDELGSVVFAAGKTDDFRKVTRVPSQSSSAFSGFVRRITKLPKRLFGV
jgi:hypothetical protein